MCFQADASGFQLCIIHPDDPELLPHFQLQIISSRNGKKEVWTYTEWDKQESQLPQGKEEEGISELRYRAIT